MPETVPYNPVIDCLSRLRCEPHGNAIGDIAADMGVSEKDVLALLGEIEAKGFKVVRWHEGARWVAAIGIDDWPKAARRAAAYVDLRENGS